MAWYLSPSGWPTYALDGSLYAVRLTELGWTSLPESQVQAKVDAYNLANGVSVPAPSPALTAIGLILSPTQPVNVAPGTVWINNAV